LLLENVIAADEKKGYMSYVPAGSCDGDTEIDVPEVSMIGFPSWSVIEVKSKTNAPAPSSIGGKKIEGIFVTLIPIT
jgi:hypothetical protein